MPRGLHFNYHENRLFVRCLLCSSSFLRCLPYVHVMTTTNTVNFVMKIPKAVVCSLKRFVDVRASANVTLEAVKDGLHVITPSSFSLCKQDGRMVIDKSSFNDFITAASLAKDNVVLISFKEGYDHAVSIVFQQLM